MTDLPRITSRENRKLKHAKRVRDGKERGQMFIEGARLANEALRASVDLVEGFVAESFVSKPRNSDLVDELTRIKVNIYSIPDSIFGSIADTENAQGIVLLGEKPTVGPNTSNFSGIGHERQLPLSLFLHRVNNPSNLGAILRTAVAAGVSGIFVSEKSADPFSPKSLRASMGSAFRLTIATDVDFGDAVRQAKEKGVVTTAADIEGTVSYIDVDWNKPRMLFFGSEAHGLEGEQKNQIEELIRIPMRNGVESLNLAVSSGIILFEAGRQCAERH